MTIQSWLWLAVCKWCKIQEIHIFKLSKIYLHSRHYFTSSNFICMQLQGIVFIQLQGNYILVNCQGNLKFIQRTYSFTRSIIIRGNYILSRNYIHFKDLISSFKEIYLRLRKTYSFREIISIQRNIFIEEHIFVNVQALMFIQGNYIHWTLLRSRK